MHVGHDSNPAGSLALTQSHADRKVHGFAEFGAKGALGVGTRRRWPGRLHGQGQIPAERLAAETARLLSLLQRSPPAAPLRPPVAGRCGGGHPWRRRRRCTPASDRCRSRRHPWLWHSSARRTPARSRCWRRCQRWMCAPPSSCAASAARAPCRLPRDRPGLPRSATPTASRRSICRRSSRCRRQCRRHHSSMAVAASLLMLLQRQLRR